LLGNIEQERLIRARTQFLLDKQFLTKLGTSIIHLALELFSTSKTASSKYAPLLLLKEV